MATINPEEMVKAKEVLATIRDEWLSRDGVTAIDLGYKWSGGEMTTVLAIRVHVARKKYIAQLHPNQLFPEEVDGIPVDIIEASYAPQALVNARPEAAVEGRGKRYDVIPIGVSVGCKYSTAGTLGAKVFDLESGKEMILSNWHVLAGKLNAKSGMAIWQPGWIDGGTREENTIAFLSRWVLGPYDAAVASLNGQRTVLTTTLEGQEIDDVTAPRLGLTVWKSGRSTGYTEGLIDGVMMQVPMDYREAGTHILERVFRIIPRPNSGPGEISIGGDSGAVWVDIDSGKAVGLHFAGEIGDTPEHALAHDIEEVVGALKVRFPSQTVPSNRRYSKQVNAPPEDKKQPRKVVTAPSEPPLPTPRSTDPKPVQEPPISGKPLGPAPTGASTKKRTTAPVLDSLIELIRNLFGLK